MAIILKRGLEANRATTSVAEGEMLFSKDTGRVYVGSGSGNLGGQEIKFFQLTASHVSATDITASNIKVTGTLEGTASWAQTATTLVGSVESASYAFTASYLVGSIESASYASTASYVLGSIESASHATNSDTASVVAWSGISGKPSLISSSAQFTQSDKFDVGEITSSGNIIIQKNNEISRITLLSSGTVPLGNAIWAAKVSGETLSSPSATLSGHYTAWQMQTFGGSTWSTTARMLMQAGADHNEGSRPTNIIFATVPSGSTTLQDRLKINGVGVQVTGSLGVSGAITSSGILSDLTGTASYALTASYVTAQSSTSSYALTASYVVQSISSSYSSTANTASFVDTARTASYTQIQVDIDRTGLVNRNETLEPSFDGTSIVTLAPTAVSWSYYRNGIKHTVSGSKSLDLLTVDNPLISSSAYYIVIDSDDGTLSAQHTPWTLDDTKLSIAVIHWNDALTPKYTISDERHTSRVDRQWTYVNHLTQGTLFVDGATLTGPTLTTYADASNTFGISQARTVDQDILHTHPSASRPDGATPFYFNYYRSGSTNYIWKLSEVPFVYNAVSGIIQYDNNGVMTDATNNSRINSYLLITNVSGSARFAIMPGRGTYSTAVLAQAENPQSFNYTGFPIDECVVAYQFTWRVSTGQANKGKCYLEVSPKQINIAATSVVSSGASISHNSLAGLQGGTTAEYYHLTATEYTALGVSSSYSSTASWAVNAITSSYIETASYATKAGGLSSGTNLEVNQITASSITVTTLFAQTVTSSVDYASGSNIFGSNITDTQRFTGSVLLTGSLISNGNTVVTGTLAVTDQATVGSLSLNAGNLSMGSNYKINILNSTPSAPGLVDQSNPTTGLYLSASMVGVSIAGVNALAVNSSRNVGIGKNTGINAVLDVLGNTTVSGAFSVTGSVSIIGPATASGFFLTGSSTNTSIFEVKVAGGQDTVIGSNGLVITNISASGIGGHGGVGLGNNDGAALAVNDRMGAITFFGNNGGGAASTTNAVALTTWANTNWVNGSSYGSKFVVELIPSGSITRNAMAMFDGNGLSITGSVTASTGFFGTSSWANNARTASYVLASYVSSSVVSSSNFWASRILVTGSATVTGALSVLGTIQDTYGNIRAVAQNKQTVAYTLTSADIGRHIYTTASVTVPPSVFAVGDVSMIVNSGSVNLSIITGSGVSFFLAGAGTTGNRTLGTYGAASITCVASNTFYLSGAGLS